MPLRAFQGYLQLLQSVGDFLAQITISGLMTY